MKISVKLKLSTYIKSVITHLGLHVRDQLSFYGHAHEKTLTVKNWVNFIEYNNNSDVIDQRFLESPLNLDSDPIIVCAQGLQYENEHFQIQFLTAKSWTMQLLPAQYNFQPRMIQNFSILHAENVNKKIAERIISNLGGIVFQFMISYSDLAFDIQNIGTDFVVKPTEKGMIFFNYANVADNIYKVIQKRNKVVLPASSELKIPEGFKEVFDSTQLTTASEASGFNAELYLKLLQGYQTIKDAVSQDLTNEDRMRIEKALDNTDFVNKVVEETHTRTDGVDSEISESGSEGDPDKSRKDTSNTVVLNN